MCDDKMDTDASESTDPAQEANPITEKDIPRVAQTCEGGTRLIAGFINTEEPKSNMEVLVLHLDDDLDAKLQKAWDDYPKDPTICE